MKAQTKQQDKETKHENVASALGSRGRTFEGYVVKKFHKRVVVEFERTVFVKKYERFYKKKTRLHARLHDSMEKEIHIGDYIQIRECRPLSKIIHFIVIKKIRSASADKGDKK
jgi:small subunit ribosomal protein S17